MVQSWKTGRNMGNVLPDDIKSNISSYLIRHPGVKAREIADNLGLERSQVNGILYSNSLDYSVDDEYCWAYVGQYPYADKVLKKLNNAFNAREYSEKDFDELANWEEGYSLSGNGKGVPVSFPNGDKVYTDSTYEIEFLNYLKRKKLALRYGGQALRISYSSAFKEKKNYNPDIIILTPNHHIAIIEIKPVTAMSQHSNVEKYRALAEYCKSKGFEYMMVDPEKDYMTFEELSELPVLPDLIPYFRYANKNPDKYRYFDSEKVELWYKKYGKGFSKDDFELQIHSLIVFYGWYNKFKNGFEVTSRPVQNGKIGTWGDGNDVV